MSDPVVPTEPDHASGKAGAEDPDGPFPWDQPTSDDLSAEASAQDTPRPRHDAFTEARKNQFLRALVKTGCIQDACRRIGVSPRTIYRHQQDSPSFFDNCCTALRMVATPVELTAWKRAVEGVEEEVVVGGKVQVRRRYSEGTLRMLLQGSDPKKYGPRPGFKRKRLLKHERKQMEREIRAEIAAEDRRLGGSFEDAVESIMTKIDAIERHGAPEKFAAGWTKSPDDHWIPPGYAPVPGYSPPPADEPREDCGLHSAPTDSM